MLKSKILDRWFYFPIITLSIYFIIRLINQSQMMWIFPLDFTNDHTSYIALLFFFVKYGYHQLVPYWYNGFILFKYTPPAWYFFTLPIYWIVKNVQIATYISRLLIYLFGFFVIWFIGKKLELSKIKRVAFFLFFFANAITIGNFLRLGRIPEMFAVLMVVILTSIIFWFKDHKINKNFIWFIPPYSILLLSHQSPAIVFHVLLLSLFIIKSNKERLYIILAVLAGMILSSFWLLPYIFTFTSTAGVTEIQTEHLFLFNKENLPQNIATFIIPLAIFLVFYFYWKSKDYSKKELAFFSPILLLNFLLFTRLVYFVPLLKYVFPDSQMYLLLLVAIFMFFTTEFENKIKIFVIILLFLMPIISVATNVLLTPPFIHPTQDNQAILDLLSLVKGKFILLNMPSHIYQTPYYAYAPIYFNLTTAHGWSEQIATQEYNNKLEDIRTFLDKRECNGLVENMNYFNITEVIAYNSWCNTLQQCNFKHKRTENKFCLYAL